MVTRLTLPLGAPPVSQACGHFTQVLSADEEAEGQSRSLHVPRIRSLRQPHPGARSQHHCDARPRAVLVSRGCFLRLQFMAAIAYSQLCRLSCRRRPCPVSSQHPRAPWPALYLRMVLGRFHRSGTTQK